MSISAKTEQNRVKESFVILSIVILLLLVGIFSLQAFGNKNVTIKSQAEITQTNTKEHENSSKSKLTIWKIINMTDWLLWPFILITAAGIMMIIYYSLLEHQEKTRARILLNGPIKSGNVKSLGRILQASKPNRAARLMNQMLNTFNKTNHAEPIGDEVNQFITGERESFETFNRVTGFLSDTAGALGLLGTVWGIFQTFHAGKLDAPTILQGMSISLVTTLVGLIISLLLNMGSTYVFTIFNTQLKAVTTKAEELRQALLHLENNSPANSLQFSKKPSNGERVKPRFDSEKYVEAGKAADVIY